MPSTKTSVSAELVNDLIRRQVAVIATAGDDVALAAKAATTTIPIVFIVRQDPVRLGLVASLARPGGNVTGVNFFSGELAAKRLAFLRELVPGAARIAVIVNPANVAITEPTLSDVEAAARAARLQINVLNASTAARSMPPSPLLSRERPDALLRQRRPVLDQPARSIRQFGDPPRNPGGIFEPRICRERRADELRIQHLRCISAGWCVCRPNSQGRASRRICRSCKRPNSSLSSTSRPPGCSASTVPPTLLARADEVIE